MAQLPEKLERTFHWQHHPIRDLSAPSEGVEEDSLLSQWFGLVSQGGRILLHCAAGLGRTGTVAARLLMMAGHDADTAIHLIRAARPGTIESVTQERFLRQPD